MANPLAKNIMANIANQMKVQRDTSHKNHKEMDSKYEGLLKDVIHKRVEKKEEKRIEKTKKINEKREMTLEDFGNLLTGGAR